MLAVALVAGLAAPAAATVPFAQLQECHAALAPNALSCRGVGPSGGAQRCAARACYALVPPGRCRDAVERYGAGGEDPFVSCRIWLNDVDRDWLPTLVDASDAEPEVQAVLEWIILRQLMPRAGYEAPDAVDYLTDARAQLRGPGVPFEVLEGASRARARRLVTGPDQAMALAAIKRFAPTLWWRDDRRPKR